MNKMVIKQNSKQGYARKLYEICIAEAEKNNAPIDLSPLNEKYTENEIKQAENNINFNSVSLSNYDEDYEESEFMPLEEWETKFDYDDEMKFKKEKLYKAIDKLPTELMKECVRLHFFNNLKFVDIGSRLNVTDYKVKLEIKNSLRILNDILS